MGLLLVGSNILEGIMIETDSKSVTRLPEEMTKGELLVELLHKGQDNLARSSAIKEMEARIELLEQALAECGSAADSLEHSAPEMAPLHIARIRGAVTAASKPEAV